MKWTLLILARSEDISMAFKVLEIQPTPNPNAAKFVLDQPCCEAPTSFFSAEAGKQHELAKKLFAIPGVSSLLLLGDFITVNKTPDVRWEEITDAVRCVLETA